MTDSERSEDHTDSTESIQSIEANLTRRDTLRAGLLASSGLVLGEMVSGSAVASTSQTTQNEGSTNNKAVPVTWANYPRANCHAVIPVNRRQGRVRTAL